MTSADVAVARGAPIVTDARAIRRDVQGLRTIGALLVAVFHIWEGGVSGGVDVFFVVAGYFLGLGYARLLERGEGLRAGDHFGRFIRRTVPEVLMVLGAILLLGLLLTAPVQWRPLMKDLAYSAVYLENYWLIERGQDYLARDETASLAQHFWAVSLIAQAYVVWFPLTLLAGLVARQAGANPRSVLSLVLVGLVAASLAWSIVWTAREPVAAYFDLTTRYWQFGIGALLGLWSHGEGRLALPRRLATPLSWIGLGLILSCGVVIGARLDFPGHAALWPVAGAALILVAGRAEDRANAGHLLGLRPLAALGAYAFGIYLWHWPIYAIVLERGGGAMPSLPAGVAIILAATILAWGSLHLAARLTAWAGARLRPGVVAAALTAGLVGLAGFATVAHALLWRPQYIAVLEGSELVMGELHGITPGPFAVRADNPVTYASGCHQNMVSPEIRRCGFGPEDAAHTVLLVGGSHSAHWLPSLQAVAEARDWRIVSITKSECIFGSATDAELYASEGYHPSCGTWNRDLVELILAERPDVVVGLATRPIFARPDQRMTSNVVGEHVPDGYVEHFQRLVDAGVGVVAIRDTPWMGRDIPNCVYARRYGGAEACGKARGEVLDDAGLAAQLARLPEGVAYVDMIDAVCEDDHCGVLRDGMLIYRDRHHLSATYAAHIGPLLAERMEAAMAAAREAGP